MSAAQHTPGPWLFAIAKTPQQLGKVYPTPRADVQNTGLVGCIATVGRPGMALAEGEALANARLIAAAPTITSEADAFTLLVERFMRADLPDGMQPATEAEVAEAMYALRALIAKATGRRGTFDDDDKATGSAA